MYCLKCGRETDEEQAFCLDCQKEMTKYPIDPNASVLLPVRKQTAQKKPAKRRIPPEEQIRNLKRQAKLLGCLLIAAIALVICLMVPVFRSFGKQQFQVGQNYTTVKPKVETTGTEPVDE